jgi:hypothetical protein
MAAGSGIRTRLPSYQQPEKRTRHPARLFSKTAQPGGAFSLGKSKRSVLTGLVASSTGRPPPSGEPVAVALSGRWAIALILKPVPNVSADNGRLDAFW